MRTVLTDLGIVYVDNANYLYKQNIINDDGFIKNTLHSGLSAKDNYREVQGYSLFRWVCEDIVDRIPDKPIQVYIDLNDQVTLMRTGDLSILYKYKSEGKEIEGTYRAKYPKVGNIFEKGKDLYVSKHANTKKEAWDNL